MAGGSQYTLPFPGETVHPGPYSMAQGVEDANTYRVGVIRWRNACSRVFAGTANSVRS